MQQQAVSSVYELFVDETHDLKNNIFTTVEPVGQWKDKQTEKRGEKRKTKAEIAGSEPSSFNPKRSI